MTNRARAILLAILLAFAASCNGNPDPGPASNYDWCYTFDFLTSDYGFAVSAGEWNSYYGLVPDINTGSLVVSYTNDLTVRPDRIVVNFARIYELEPSSINLSANAIIFGLATPGTVNVTIAADVDSYSQPLWKETASDYGSTVNASIQVSDYHMAIQSLEVYGFGVSPFPSNPCGLPSTDTPTPFIATAAPTNTAIPDTATPTPPTTTPTHTRTPTPSPTPNNSCYWFFFCEDWKDYTYSPWLTISSTYDGAWSSEGYLAGPSRYADPVGLIFIIDFPAPVCVNGWGYYDKNSGGGGGNISVRNASNIEIASSVIPGGSTNWTYSGGLAPGGVCIPNVTRIVFTGTSASVRQVDDFRVDAHWMVEPTATNTPMSTGTPTLPTATPTSTVTPFSTHIGTQAPSATPGTGVPTIVGTATSTGTRIPVGIYTLPPLGTLPPPITPNATGTANYFGTTTAVYGGTGTPGPNATEIYIPWDGGSSGGIDGIQSGIGEIGRGVLGFGSNAMSQAFGYVRTLSAQLGTVINSWNSAQPTTIPGLPNCTGSSRLQSEVCAIYYILTYTIFSGTLGSLIMPLATADLYLIILFVFLKRARAIAARIAEVVKT